MQSVPWVVIRPSTCAVDEEPVLTGSVEMVHVNVEGMSWDQFAKVAHFRTSTDLAVNKVKEYNRFYVRK